ncbi:uncharacterized protein LOC117781048 isoform X2 [Drosophila innubila]|uniref:uncharacterized protein LOC117781048 isoform X2 n=1 Tax=Drosophila innubila TaxID=198719 RepID=UPI00148D56B1|nr:uncharacterized protein LOC117781048 isoform X2 [Drosophila innubila]
MIIFEKFLFCLPLRQGCLIMGYFLIIQGFADVFAMMMIMSYCPRLKKLWFLKDQINIVAGILLLASTHSPDNLAFLVPIHIFVKLTGLIIELLFYLLLASFDDLGDKMTVYSFTSIIVAIRAEANAKMH